MARRKRGGGGRSGGGSGGSSGGGGGGVDWTNLPEWQGALAQALGRLRLETEGDLDRFATRVQNEARRLAPVDTGRLRSSIQRGPLQRDRLGAFVEVGTNVAYAPFVEFGTFRSPGQPYLRPALLQAATRGLR